MNCYTGTYWKTRPNSVSRSIREHTSGFFWNSHGWCRIFRRIFWYHRLLPQKFFCRVIWDLGHFFDFGFWPVTRKRLILETWFRLWGPLCFQFPTRWPIFIFYFLQIFWKKGAWPSPYFLVLGRGQEGGNWHVTVWIFEYIHDEISLRAIMTEVKMADGSSVEEGIIIGNALKVKCNETKM